MHTYIYIRSLLIMALLMSGILQTAIATQITIVNLDGSNEGFRDNTSVLPVGGNTGTTIGEQRLQVFQYAAQIWESILDSNVEIKVDANFDPLTCSSTSAVLGSAGTVDVFRDFTNAPISRTWYTVALANSIANRDLSASSDIRAIFNSSVDNNNNCLNNTNWYYGLDGNNPANTMNLLFVVLHEIGHGLGFLTLVDVNTGRRLGNPGRNDVFMLNLEDHSLGKTWDQLNDSQRLDSIKDTADLHWTGPGVTAKTGDFTSGVNQGHIQHYAPATIAAGSSVSHFDTALAPNELMEPFITNELKGPGLATQLMQDIGWTVFANFKPVVGEVSDITMSGNYGLTEFVVRDEDTSLNSLIFDFTSSNPSLINSSGFSISGEGSLRTINVSPNTGIVGSSSITMNVSDGVNVVSRVFQLTVTNTSPSINISSPVTGDKFILSDSILLQAEALDAEDGVLSENIQWSSTIDGVIGSGALLTTSLSEGSHSITAGITDSGGLTTNQTVTVDVYGDADLDGMNDLWELTEFGTLDRDGTGDFDGDGISDLDEYLISVAIPDGDLNNDGLVNVVDMLIAQKILNGQLIITPLQMAHGDVAPLVGGVPAPNGIFDVADMLVLTRKVSGEITY